jgi:rare lipoprotein A
MKIFIALSAFVNTMLPSYEGTGKATYYGQHWTGRLTASGEKFHPDSLTCAHKTLTFGTILNVTDLRNGKSITVRVNDRLPKGSKTLVDLTYGSAKALGFIEAGVIPVKVVSINRAKQ